MKSSNDQSEYAPPSRIDKDELKNHVNYLLSIPHFKEIINSLSSIALITNTERQVLFASDDFLKLVEDADNSDILGMRPGEILNCINKDKNKNGCGSSKYCKTCGFVNTILESQQNQQKVSKEARITINHNGFHESLDLKITTSPLPVYDVTFYITTIIDITDEKRRKVLERMFFHDILNTAGGFNSLVEYFHKELIEDPNNEFFKMASVVSKSIYDQIISYKQLSLAEKGELKLTNSIFSTLELIHEVIELFNANSKQKYIIEVDANVIDIELNVDKTLLYRIITNMIKNATEAPSEVEPAIILVNSEKYNGYARISVQNNYIMSDEIQFQVFQRSFSTKDEGRGIGTYSMKLLGEKYLGGKVDFVSNNQVGTIFYIDLPLDI